VRIVTRTDARRATIEAAGAECWIGDPDRLGTLRAALDSVTIACWLLGSATGTEEQLRALHGPRLEAFIGQIVDSTVRGFVYEAAGTAAPPGSPAAGARLVRELAARNAIPCVCVHQDPAHVEDWLADARTAVGSLLGG